MTNAYPRETIEFQEVTVTVDDTPVTDFQTCVTGYNERPTAWSSAVSVDGKRGVMVSGLTAGVYTIWAKVTDNPEVPVVNCGDLVIT